MMILRVSISIIIITLIFSIMPHVNAQSTYVQLPNDSIVWMYNNELIAYSRDSTNGLVKVAGPSSLQSVPISTLESIESDIKSNPNYNPNNNNDQYYEEISNPQRWYFINDKAIWVNIFKGYTPEYTWDIPIIFRIVLDLNTLSYTVFKNNYSSRSDIDIYLINVIQFDNKIYVLWKDIDRASIPDDGYFRITRINVDGSYNTIHSVYHIYVGSIDPVVRILNNEKAIISFAYNLCINTAIIYKIETVFLNTANDAVTVTYSDIGLCTEHTPAQPDPTLQTITFHRRIGDSAILTQTINNESTTYRCEMGGSGSTTASVLQPCLEFSNVSVNALFLSGVIRTVDELVNANNTFAYYLFPDSITNPTSYNKSLYHIITQDYTFNLNLIGIKRYANEKIIALGAERAGSFTTDPSKLIGTWQIITANNTLPVHNIHYSNKIVINNIEEDYPNQTLKLRWSITAGGNEKVRIMPFNILLASNQAFAGMFITSNDTVYDVLVRFTDTALTNTNVVIKLVGFNALITNTTINSNNELTFFAFEGNCYSINRVGDNNSLLYLAQVCPPPNEFTIGPSESGGSEGFLLGIYWYPNWYVHHIHYPALNKLDVIIHKNPAPFTYKIELKDKDNNMYLNTPYTQSPQDPLTVTIALDPDLYPYYLLVRGVEVINNEEKSFIAYTATISKGYNIPTFLPFTSFGINAILLVAVVSLALWTRNTASIGVVVSVVSIATLNWLGLLQLSEALLTLLFFIAAIAIIIARRVY